MPRTIEQFIAYGEETGIVGAIGRSGCSASEIEVLERTCSVVLPHTYRQYLATMGHFSSLLFSHDHIQASYRHVLELAENLADWLREDDPDLELPLPEDGFVIASRFGDVLWYIRCNDVTDSPVWLIVDPEYRLTQVAESFVEWLFGCVWEAKAAIESGWYSRPQG